MAGSDSSRGLLLWQRSEAEVWLDDVDLWEQLLGLWGLDAWVDDDIVTWDPVDWGGDLVLVASLYGIPISFLCSFCSFLWKYAESTLRVNCTRMFNLPGASQQHGEPQQCCDQWMLGRTESGGWSSLGQ